MRLGDRQQEHLVRRIVAAGGCRILLYGIRVHDVGRRDRAEFRRRKRAALKAVVGIVVCAKVRRRAVSVQPGTYVGCFPRHVRLNIVIPELVDILV